MKTKIGIKILPRDVILDTQGRAIEQSLSFAHEKIENCRVGKYIELVLEGDEAAALKKADEISKMVLHNPLLEKYQLEVIKA